MCQTANGCSAAEKYLQVWDAFDLRVAGQVEVLLCLKDTLCNPNAMLVEDQTVHKVSEVKLGHYCAQGDLKVWGTALSTFEEVLVHLTAILL